MQSRSWINADLPLFAHRGLHNADNGIYENTIAAFDSAFARHLGVELDVQLSADDVPMIFHDATLDRLTAHSGITGTLSAQELGDIKIGGTADVIPTLEMFLDRLPQDLPALIEIKIFDHIDSEEKIQKSFAIITQLAERFDKKIALMSFDPNILSHQACRIFHGPIGLVAERHFHKTDWPGLSLTQRFSRRLMLSRLKNRPDFISYNVKDRDAIIYRLWNCLQPHRQSFWTVRDSFLGEQLESAGHLVTFENYVPTTV